jgi:hypothetical protein
MTSSAQPRFVANSPVHGRHELPLAKVTIAITTWCSVVGWSLSAFHELNVRGYAIAIGLTLVALTSWWASAKQRGQTCRGFRIAAHRFIRHCRQPLPACFILIAALSIISGFLYEPNNGDTMSYRVPRVLHWLARNQWHWLGHPDSRMDFLSPGVEWIYAPLLLFTHSDRLLFLLNVAAFVQLPGLSFVLFREMGMSPRAAWHWMWVAAAGWTFVLQASGVVNDLFAVPFALAALGLALRARRRHSVSDWWWSLLAAALMTNVKQSNLVLLLPWLAAAGASWRLPLQRPAATLALAVVALFASCAPTTFFNLQHTGSWIGWSKDAPPVGETGFPESPWVGVLGNSFTLAVRNLVPPIFPWAPAWNAKMDAFLATSFGSHFRSFQLFGHVERAGQEEVMGFGMLPCLLLVMSVGAGMWHLRQRKDTLPKQYWKQRLVSWGLAVATVVFLAKVATATNARLFAPFYIPLLAVFLSRTAQDRIVRQQWWQRFALLVVASGIALVIFSRTRPLWPANTVAEGASRRWPESKLVTVLARSYSYTARTQRYINDILSALPPGERVIGKVSWVPGEAFLSKPYTTREIVHITANQTPEAVRASGVRYVVLSEVLLRSQVDGPVENWMQRWNAEMVRKIPVHLHPEDPSEPEQFVYVVRLR